MKLKYSSLFSLCMFLSLIGTEITYAQSNEGVDFWFGFMEHRDAGTNTMVAMITSKVATNGTISIPNQGWSQSFSVAANNVTIITLPYYVEVYGSENIEDAGIHLTSSSPVSVYIHQYHNARSEASIVLPVSSLGKEYFAMTYTGVLQQGEIYPSEFLIVSTQDETIVEITVSDETKGNKPAGTTFSVELNKGETYQVQAAQSSGDLTGSFIKADKKIALFGGNSWTQVPSNCTFRDNLLEQMYPLETWGKKFVTIPNQHMSYDVFRILAAEDNTEIFINGVNTYTLNAGEFKEYQRSTPAYIESQNPLLIAQFTIGQSCNGHFVGDPSMVLLNSIEQTRDTVTLYNSSLENITENYINITMSTTDAPFVTFDGTPLQGNFPIQTAGLSGEFSYVQLTVSTGAHTIISDGCGIIVSAYGFGNVESYAYSGGASFKNINANPIPEGGCLNDTVFFDVGLSPNRYSFFWDLGDGSTTTEGVFSHFYPELGSYPITLIIEDHCLSTLDTTYRDLKITLRQAVDAIGEVLECQGASFSLAATDLAEASYEWTGPNGYFSEEQFPTINNSHPDMTGDYSVIGIISGCATFPAFTPVEIIPTPEPYLGPDTIFCSKEFEFILNPGIYSKYQWSTGSSNQSIKIEEEGIYSIQVTDEYGCVGEEEVLLEEICPTKVYAPNVFSPNNDGFNDNFQIFAFDIIDYHLTIFSRWGELVFESDDQSEFWDGSFKGKKVNNEVYVWQLELTGYREDGSIYSDAIGGSVLVLQ